MQFWWQSIILAALALTIVVRGIRGRFVGDEPRCIKCKYRLDGLCSQKCPECGIDINERTVVFGVRKIRWKLLALLIFLPFIWLPSQQLVWTLINLDWFRYYPTRLVIHGAEKDEVRSILEIERRLQDNVLEKSHRVDLVELALDRYRKWPVPKYADAWSRILDGLEFRGFLTDEQENALFGDFSKTNFQVRPVISQGGSLVFRLEYSASQAALDRYRFWHRALEIRVDGDLVFSQKRGLWRKGRTDWQRTNWTSVRNSYLAVNAGNLSPGKHTVAYSGEHIFMHPKLNSETDPPSWSKIVKYEAQFEVLPRDAPNPISWIDAPKYQDEIKQSLRVTVRQPWPQLYEQATLNNTHERQELAKYYKVPEADSSWKDQFSFIVLDIFCWRGPPVPVAFEIDIIANDVRLPAQTIWHLNRNYGTKRAECVLAWRKRERWYTSELIIAPRFEAKEFYVVLRGCRNTARNTLDMYEVWKGEVTYGPFSLPPIKQGE